MLPKKDPGTVEQERRLLSIGTPAAGSRALKELAKQCDPLPQLPSTWAFSGPSWQIWKKDISCLFLSDMVFELTFHILFH